MTRFFFRPSLSTLSSASLSSASGRFPRGRARPALRAAALVAAAAAALLPMGIADAVPAAQTLGRVVALTGATLIDGTGRAPIGDGVLVIRDGRIAAVGGRDAVPIPSEASVVPLEGMFVMPGLVNAHGHVNADGGGGLKRLSDGGVRIALGTDTGAGGGRWQGYFEHVELAMMVEAGLSPMQAIVAATKNAADGLGLRAVGTLEPGKWADLLVLGANPVDDIRHTREIADVWIAGRPLGLAATGASR